ncbi:hypothetical protein CX954_01320 [Campylobacter coli]|nr:hypothetical protein [Campylobacter coli]EAJ3368423.1 hypothetical protein [Campylobacter coli]EAK3550625.1 hypothetical protein [Campylobacter coli]EAK3551823.1 hypothetical protein [Campylobacter coli]EAL3103344.1 hypothetical protein [Campylobacter coli]
MKIGLLLCFFVSLVCAQIYKGEIYFYDLKDKQVFAIVYDNAPFVPIFDRDVNQTSSSFLILSDLDTNIEIALFQTANSWEDGEKKYKISSSKELAFDNKKIQGNKLGTTTLELIKEQNNIRIKRSLDFLAHQDEIRQFRPMHNDIVSFEQIRQKPIVLKDGKLSFEEWYYFYEEDNRAILELNNFVFDMDKKVFLSLNELYDVDNLKFKELLHQKLNLVCDECFDDMEQVFFNNNFLITNLGSRLCYLPYENHYLNENICVDFNENEIKEFRK